MIRRLRFKLTAITAVLLTVILAGILLFVNYSTRQSLRSASLEALETAGSLDPHRPGKQYGAANCFVLELKPDGSFVAIGPDSYGLEDRDDLTRILWEAVDTGKRTGELDTPALRFLKVDSGPGMKYAFCDISGEIQAISRLNMTSLLIFILGVFVFSV